jgi:hypothetical protein
MMNLHGTIGASRLALKIDSENNLLILSRNEDEADSLSSHLELTKLGLARTFYAQERLQRIELLNAKLLLSREYKLPIIYLLELWSELGAEFDESG